MIFFKKQCEIYLFAKYGFYSRAHNEIALRIAHVTKIVVNNKTIKFSTRAKVRETSSIKALIENNQECVWKSIMRFGKTGILQCEVSILKLLSNFSWALKLVWCNSYGLIITCAGKPFNMHNISLDCKDQIEKIIIDMESLSINNNDMCPKNFIVHNAKSRFYPRLSLIDFGLVTRNGEHTFNENILRNPRHLIGTDRNNSGQLDGTFRKHLHLEHHLLIERTQFLTKDQIHETMKK